MKLNQLIKIKNKGRKRLGRGISAGGGKTAGRGTKGQKSRSGKNIPRRLSSTRMSEILRLPKKRVKKFPKTRFTVVKVVLVDKNFKEGEKVNPKTLYEKRLIESQSAKVKIVGGGKLTKKLVFQNLKFTKSVKTQIDKLGKVEMKKLSKKGNGNVSRRRANGTPRTRRRISRKG